jgi:hypothetical protein
LFAGRLGPPGLPAARLRPLLHDLVEARPVEPIRALAIATLSNDGAAADVQGPESLLVAMHLEPG